MAKTTAAKKPTLDGERTRKLAAKASSEAAPSMAARLDEKTKRSRPRQQSLAPDLEPPRVREIDDQAERYLELRRAHRQLTDDLKNAKTALYGLMKVHELRHYDGEILTVDVVTVEEKITVKERSGDDADSIEVYE